MMAGPPNDSRLPIHSMPSSTPASSLAKTIDPFAVYEQAVQTPAIECANLASFYYNAQPIGSRRPEARVLREDFSSTGAVAVRWVNMAEGNRSQAVDLDLEALRIARRRLLRQERDRAPGGERWTAKLLQHGELNEEGGSSQWLAVDEQDERASGNSASSSGERSTTWAEGATSDRFERKYQARMARQQKGKDKKKLQLAGEVRRRQRGGHEDEEDRSDHDGTDSLSSLSFTNGNAHVDRQELEAPHLLCIHSSVLSLPVPLPLSSTKSHNHDQPADVCPPDIVASLNYALSYFHKRSDMLTYLRGVRKSLRPGTGVLVCDQFAGPLGEAAHVRAGRGARQLSAMEEHEEQEVLWRQFAKEEGFLRRGETMYESLPQPLDAAVAGIQVWKPHARQHAAAHSQDGAAASQWPRGRLSLVRKGTVPHPTVKGRNVAFEYWREDASVDLVTNRFRMSLSFRFSEDGECSRPSARETWSLADFPLPLPGSWTRDFFSYDFRFWTLAEVLEAMDEAGFVDVSTQVLDRSLAEDDEDEDRSDASSVDSGEDPDADLAFLARTEKEESREDKAGTTEYRKLKEREKVFARKSFASEYRGTYSASTSL